MHHHSAFTLTDMLAAMVLIVIVFVLYMGTCGQSSPRRQARGMQNSVHLLGIRSGMVSFAQGNKDYYPGLTANGEKATESVAADAGQKSYGFATADGTLTAYRFAVLVRGSYFSRDYLKNPAETNDKIIIPVAGQNFADGSAYSYAMLNISDVKAPRVREWKATNNSRAAVVSDRNIGPDATGTGAQSLHTSQGEGWRGTVCYNDGHVIFETTDMLKTSYGKSGTVVADLLFSDQEKTEGNVANADAAMVFKAGDSYVNQQP